MEQIRRNIISVMEKMYCWSKTVFTKAPNKVIAAVLLVLVIVVPCDAQPVQGVLYAKSSGQGANPTGLIRIAIGKGVAELYYSKSQLKFTNPLCFDIGAIWLIEADGDTLLRAKCDGKVDEWAHGSWSVVKEFLDRLRQGRPTAFDELAPQWRVSPSSQHDRDQLKALNFSDYRTLGTGANCLEVTTVNRTERTRIGTGADCHLYLNGQLVELTFNVIRNKSTRRFEIHSVTIHLIRANVEFFGMLTNAIKKDALIVGVCREKKKSTTVQCSALKSQSLRPHDA